MSAGDGLSHAHRSRDVHAEDNGDVLCGITANCSVLHLGGSLEQICDSRGLRNLFFSNHNFVLFVTEFALPDLVAISISEHTHLVKDGLTAKAYLGITSRHLAFVSEDVKGDLEDVGVEFLIVSGPFLLFYGAF